MRNFPVKIAYLLTLTFVFLLKNDFDKLHVLSVSSLSSARARPAQLLQSASQCDKFCPLPASLTLNLLHFTKKCGIVDGQLEIPFRFVGAD